MNYGNDIQFVEVPIVTKTFKDFNTGKNSKNKRNSLTKLIIQSMTPQKTENKF